MTKYRYSLRARAFLVMTILLTLVLVGFLAQGKPLVITTTTVGKDLVDQVGGEYVENYTIIPSGLCPSHYDVKPSDYDAVKDASLVIFHGVEPWLEGLLQATGNQDVLKHETGGPWNLPPNAAEIGEEIAESLSEVDPDHEAEYSSNAEKFRESIEQLSSQLQEEAQQKEVEDVKAIVMQWQKAFLLWLGFQVVADYPPPETVSAKNFDDLVRTGEEEEVTLIVDNLQSGTDFGAKLANKLEANHVVLSNFPEGDRGYEGLIRSNVEKLFGALDREAE
ncbi:MAG: metal ABC transporter substrate-binding protein [Candidatus Bipolaricaulota bacterium]